MTATLVIGGGPAGLAAAWALARAGRPVMVAEARSVADPRRPAEHLPPAALRQIAGLGLGRLLDDPRHLTCRGVVSLWGAGAPLSAGYAHQLPPRGLILDRAAFAERLAGLAQMAGARICPGVRMLGTRTVDGGHRVTLRDGTGTQTREFATVIDAAGRGRIGRAAGCDRMLGLSGLLSGQAEAGGRVLIEAVRDGWWYAAPRPGGTLALLVTDRGTLAASGQSPTGFWQDNLRRSRLLAGLGATDVTVRGCDIPVGTGPALPGAPLAVGDAAMAPDPLSASGLASALADALAAVAALIAPDRDAALARLCAARRGTAERHDARRREAYGNETRWIGAPFWQARRAATGRAAEERIGA